MSSYDLFCIAGYNAKFIHMRASKNEFIKPAGHVKLPVMERYKLHGMVGLCKYGHI